MAKVLNCANTPVDKAVAYATEQCSADGKSMTQYFSDFKTNYRLLQEKCGLALDLPRIEMPVIEPEQMDEFQESLSKGHIDVKEPVAKTPQSKSKYPTDLGFDLRGRQWLYRGTRDGAIQDDILDAQMTEIAVADLKPSQSQIWLEKVVGMSLYFGPLKQSSEFLHEAPIIVSSDGYILDGHHRFGAAMVSNPSLRLTALKVDMEIRELVKMARSYGNAIGNEQKAAETFEAEYTVPKPKVMPSFMGSFAKMSKQNQQRDMQRRLDGIWRKGDRDEVSIKHIYYSLGALGAGRDWHTQTDYGFEMNKIDMVQRMWWAIQAIRDELGLEAFKELVASTPNYGEAFEQYEYTFPNGEVLKGDGWVDYKSESFEAEMDKVVDVDCVNIVSKKSAFTGKDRNFYRVSFRDSGQYDRFGIPAWASKAAKTMGEKYYGVSGCQMVMGMLPSGKWQIQAILIPNTEKMNKQMALKIANHMQDRIEKEGKWAKKKCREDEIIQIYQADEYGAESFEANAFAGRWKEGSLRLIDEDADDYAVIQFFVRKNNADSYDVVLNDTIINDERLKPMKDSSLGDSYWIIGKIRRDRRGWKIIVPVLSENTITWQNDPYHSEGHRMLESHRENLYRAVDSIMWWFREDYGGLNFYNWVKSSSEAETFNAMSFNQWSQDEMNEELHGGRNMQFKEWLDDEVHTHGNIPLKEWGYEEENDEPEHQHAESMVRKPAYGLFGLSFITGILLNMARKD